LYDNATATITSRQATLFDPNDVSAGDSPLTCCTCGRPMVRTDSGFLCCTAGHGKLIDEGAMAADREDEGQDDGDRWEFEAAVIAHRHDRRARWLDHPACQCGACRFTRGLASSDRFVRGG
jgi:hypothetical protein